MKKNENRKSDSQVLEVNVIAVLKELLRKLWLIILVGVIVGGATFVGAKIIVKPTYRSGFTAYVNNKQDSSKQAQNGLTSSDVNASKQIVQTYQKILTSNTILTASAEAMGIDKSYDSLKSKVSTEIKDETEIIAVYVIDKDPQFAYDYAQAISKTAPQYMTKIVEGSSMKIIDYPEYSDTRYQPNYTRFALVGFAIGAIIVAIIVIIRFFMDDTVKDENEIESRFSIPILGVIPDITRASDSHSNYYYYAQSDKPEDAGKSEKSESEL